MEDKPYKINHDKEWTDLDPIFAQIEEAKDFVTHRDQLDSELKPEIKQTCAYWVSLKKDKTYYYCTCG